MSRSRRCYNLEDHTLHTSNPTDLLSVAEIYGSGRGIQIMYNYVSFVSVMHQEEYKILDIHENDGKLKLEQEDFWRWSNDDFI
jgi:hypothetical protein